MQQGIIEEPFKLWQSGINSLANQQQPGGKALSFDLSAYCSSILLLCKPPWRILFKFVSSHAQFFALNAQFESGATHFDHFAINPESQDMEDFTRADILQFLS